MGVIELLASNRNRRDEIPNQEMAVEIINTQRMDWVEELVENLKNKDKAIQSDCIKVLYEIGERGHAEMIAPYASVFGELLKSKNNRLVWGAVTAIDTFTLLNAPLVVQMLPDILNAVDHGSVITIDHGVNILAQLASLDEWQNTAFPLLTEQLLKCPPKQLPMYAERSMIAARGQQIKSFIDLIESRLPEMEKDSQKVRLQKVLKKLRSMR